MHISNPVLSPELQIHVSNCMLSVFIWMSDSWPLNFETWPPTSSLKLCPSSVSLNSIDGNPNLPIAYAPNLGVILDNSLSLSHTLRLIWQRLWFYLKPNQVDSESGHFSLTPLLPLCTKSPSPFAWITLGSTLLCSFPSRSTLFSIPQPEWPFRNEVRSQLPPWLKTLQRLSILLRVKHKLLKRGVKALQGVTSATSLTSSPLVHSLPTSLASLLNHKNTLMLWPLNWLFPLPGILFPSYTWIIHSFSSYVCSISLFSMKPSLTALFRIDIGTIHHLTPTLSLTSNTSFPPTLFYFFFFPPLTSI